MLRSLGDQDASECYVSWLMDPQVVHHLEVRRAPLNTVNGLKQFINENNESPQNILLGIFLQRNGRHIGNIRLTAIDAYHRNADVGILIGDKAQWGNGYATTSIVLLAEYAFKSLGIEKLTAGCYHDNHGSYRAFTKAGFKEEGRLIGQCVRDNIRQDVVMLGLAAPVSTTSMVTVLQARYSSQRLPGKVLMPLFGQPMLLRQIERVRKSKHIGTLIVATTTRSDDDVIEALCAREGISCYRGAINDVLDRVYRAVEPFRPGTVVRLTGDCPLTDASVIDGCIEFFRGGEFDYVTNALQATFPDGLDVEVMTFASLRQAWHEAKLPSEREHVTPYINTRPERFRIGHYVNDRDFSVMRWTVDEPEDLEFVRAVYEELYPQNPAFAMPEILALLDARPELVALNKHYSRNEGLAKSKRLDIDWLANHSHRYARSEDLLERAQRTIPLGSQTFSKSRTQYPFGVSPYFIQRGQGSHVWDVDGNEYVDYINGLAAVTLGYNDFDVTKAVSEQLRDGVIFSLPHPLEMLVAEKIVELVPCAEMVRFGKNGSDATSGAIRIARAFTDRDHVAVCGYHGWQDWYIGTTARNRGVPQAARDLSHTWTYNDLESLAKLFRDYPGQIAAVILEPMNVVDPLPGFLESVKELAHKHGALLIFDETITGFRYAIGGAQQHFGVTPDLATFGKGLANGYPVSAVVGRADVMKLMEEVFFSFTFGGEALSLAAALATMKKLEREPVTETLYRQGKKILVKLASIVEDLGATDFLSVAGNPTWSFMLIKDTETYSQWHIKTLFLQEMFSRGILTIGTHNMSYSHSDEDLEKLFVAYAEVIPILVDALRHRKLESLLRCEPLQPLFKVR